MGMFDTIICEFPLPDSWDVANSELQTKDLECTLSKYKIDKNGRLLEERYDLKLSDHTDDFWINSTRENVHWVDTNYHGIINFYGDEKIKIPSNVSWHMQGGKVISSSDKKIRGDMRWHEYKAKFTDGNLVELRVLVDDHYFKNNK